MKLNFLFLAISISFFSTRLLSQAPTKLWDLRFGGSAYDYGQGLQQTVDGGFIIGGYSYSGISGDKSQASWGLTDYWIIKTDANGSKQWDKRFGGSDAEELTCLLQTSDGGYILGGSSSSVISGDKTQSSQGKKDYWIVKTDVNGEKQWDARFGGSEIDQLNCLTQTVDGGYLLGGYSYSGISGDKTQSNQGLQDYWIVRVDSNGQKLWDFRFGGNESDFLEAVLQTPDGGFLLGGYTYSGVSGDVTKPSLGWNDYWVVKIDANGQKQWDARYGGSNFEYLYAMLLAPDGGYILGGSSGSEISGDVTQPNRGAYDFWIVKTDVNGVKLWDVRYGGDFYDELYCMDHTADGGYILGGYSYSGIGGDKTQTCQGGPDFWMIKVNSNWVKQWDVRYGGGGTEEAYSVKEIPRRRLYTGWC
jgi:hypothetical protein